MVEAEVVAGPRRLKISDRSSEQIEFSRFWRERSPNGPTNAVNDLVARQAGEMFEYLFSDTEWPLRICGVDPQRLRLDLKDVKELGMALD